MITNETIARGAAVDPATMMRHLEEFFRRMKLSGTPQELESFRYLKARPVPEDAAAERVNATLVAVSRAMVPMDYTAGDRFEHDPALPQAPYPVLDVVRQLAAARAGSDQARFLAGSATRACNRLAFALDQANAALDGCHARL